MNERQKDALIIIFIIFLLILVISPIDAIPDVIPVVGWLDDVGYVIMILGLAKELK